jgi:hypothetical protein
MFSSLLGINCSFQNIFMFSLQVYKALLIQNQMKRGVYICKDLAYAAVKNYSIVVVSLKLHRFRLIAQVSHKSY